MVGSLGSVTSQQVCRHLSRKASATLRGAGFYVGRRRYNTATAIAAAFPHNVLSASHHYSFHHKKSAISLSGEVKHKSHLINLLRERLYIGRWDKQEVNR